MTTKPAPVRSESGSDTDYLDSLSAALNGRGHLTMIVTDGPQARLEVLDRATRDGNVTVLCRRGRDGDRWFWWGWADRIAPADDLEHAASVVHRSLRAA